jgi:hypothetical protein
MADKIAFHKKNLNLNPNILTCFMNKLVIELLFISGAAFAQDMEVVNGDFTFFERSVRN